MESKTCYTFGQVGAVSEKVRLNHGCRNRNVNGFGLRLAEWGGGSSVPCELGEGDCDFDDDCKKGLICGSKGHGIGNNCGTKFYTNAECCAKPGK